MSIPALTGDKTVFFVEPAKYSLYVADQVYKPLGFNVVFKKRFTLHNHREIEATYLEDFSFIEKLTFLIRVHKKSQLIIANGYTHLYFIVPFFLNYFVRVKRYLAIESDTPLESNTKISIKNILTNKLKKLLFSRSYVYGLAGGSQQHKRYFEFYGMKPERIYLAPMVSIPGKKRSQGNDKMRFLYVGSIIPRKQISLLINSFISKFKNNPEVELRLVGNGESLGAYHEKFSAFENITFLGDVFAEKLEEEFDKASALILPSLKEPWGMVVNEAMSYGLPVIVSDAVGARYDLVEEKETGLVFNRHSQDELEKAMVAFYNDPQKRRKYGENAYRLIHGHWNIDYYRKCITHFINHITK